MSSDEAREIAAGNALVSFMSASLRSICPLATDTLFTQVYAKGKENFSRLISSRRAHDRIRARFYLYRQIMGAHAQLGLVAAASCGEY